MSIRDDLTPYVGTRRQATIRLLATPVYFLAYILELSEDTVVLQQVKPDSEPEKLSLLDISDVTEAFLTEKDIELSYSK